MTPYGEKDYLKPKTARSHGKNVQLHSKFVSVTVIQRINFSEALVVKWARIFCRQLHSLLSPSLGLHHLWIKKTTKKFLGIACTRNDSRLSITKIQCQLMKFPLWTGTLSLDKFLASRASKNTEQGVDISPFYYFRKPIKRIFKINRCSWN